MIKSDDYLGGIFDGEGCVSAYINKLGRWVMRCSVEMADEQIVKLFFDRFTGSHIHKRKKLTAGGLQLWQWYITGSKGIEFLNFVINHCLAKGEQAKLALPIAESMNRYVTGESRRGVNLHGGYNALNDDELKLRTDAFTQLKALNGARNRFDKRRNDVKYNYIRYKDRCN